MSIKSIRWKKWLIVAVMLGMIAVGPGRYFRKRYDKEITSYIDKQNRCLKFYFGKGLEHDLAVGNIKEGDSVETLLEKYPNLRCLTAENWKYIWKPEGMNSLQYSTPQGVRKTDEVKWNQPPSVHPPTEPQRTWLLAKDGKLVSAFTQENDFYGSKENDIHIFFDLPPGVAWAAYLRAREREELRPSEQLRDRLTLQVALSGAAANVRFNQSGNFWFPNLVHPPRD